MKTFGIEWCGKITRNRGYDLERAANLDEAKAQYQSRYPMREILAVTEDAGRPMPPDVNGPMAEQPKVQHFWSPPAGVQVVGMMKFEDKIVVAANDGVYVIMPNGQHMPDWMVQKISNLHLKGPESIATDTRARWQDHIKAAITDLRNSDRSTFEQEVCDALRIFADRYLET